MEVGALNIVQYRSVYECTCTCVYTGMWCVCVCVCEDAILSECSSIPGDKQYHFKHLSNLCVQNFANTCVLYSTSVQ